MTSECSNLPEDKVFFDNTAHRIITPDISVQLLAWKFSNILNIYQKPLAAFLSINLSLVNRKPMLSSNK